MINFKTYKSKSEYIFFQTKAKVHHDKFQLNYSSIYDRITRTKRGKKELKRRKELSMKVAISIKCSSNIRLCRLEKNNIKIENLIAINLINVGLNHVYIHFLTYG